MFYPGDERLDDFLDIFWPDTEDEDEEDQWDEAEFAACNYWETEEIVSSRDPIEQKIVSYIYFDMRSDVDGTYCISCHPRVLSRDVAKTCGCNVYDHFVERWRCIPCVLAEQAKAASSGPKTQYIYDPQDRMKSWQRNVTDGMIRVRHATETIIDSTGLTFCVQRQLCPCGNHIASLDDPFVNFCRWCGGTMGGDGSDQSLLETYFYPQFGSNDSARSNDPVLSQLG